ncbi:uncharacterized protein TNCV_353671 [Trichonephila clavipes]|nr:uncharacterized protein TNCV_353671 [Trichonephila clavipes]
MVDFHKRIWYSDEAPFWLNGYVNRQNCRIWSEANPQVYVEKPLHPEKLKEMWFQQDGATCHTARATIDLLKDTLGDRLISRFGPVNWPPRSYDLTPLDYFLRGYVKSLVYADKPQTLDHLEDNIRRVIADMWPQMLEKVIENWTSRLDYIRASRGSPMPEIIFKISIRLKKDSLQEFTRQMALKKSHGIPHSALKIHTDGNLGVTVVFLDVVPDAYREAPLGISLKVEYATPTKGTSDVESRLFGRSRDDYSTIGSSTPC